MPVEWVDDPTCDACGAPATQVDVGFMGMGLAPEYGWACDDPFHSVSIDFKPIEEVFDHANDR